MNLAEALNVAIPDLPVRVARRERPPKVAPDLIVRETVEDGQPFFNVMIPETRRYYPFLPEQWKLLRLFDGIRTYAEVAELYSAETGAFFPEQYARDFAEQSRDMPFWYRSPQERNIALSEKLAEERRRRVAKQDRFSSLAEITFTAWDPDRYLSRLHDKLSFVFRPWFLLLNLTLFAWSLALWLQHWKAMGLDTVQYFDFSEKTLYGFAEFWVLMLFIGFIHESAHGLACKHTGGEVHRMGFMLIYLSPAFFCDVTEAWVYGGRWERVTTMVAGLWSEMILCFFATVVWWGTPSGTVTHRISYEFILLAGIGAVIINLNPLIKLDGYYIFTEMIGIADLKENSTIFLNTWVKKHLFQLPVEVTYVRPRRAVLYVTYAILSGAYSYTLLFVVVTLAYKVFYRYMPGWAFVPALILALLIFRSRIRTLVQFVRTVYLDKKPRFQARMRPPVVVGICVVALLIFFAPVWKQTVGGVFILEPLRRSVARTSVPGFVEQIYAFEGERVKAGARLALLRDLSLESELARIEAEYAMAEAAARRAQILYADYSRAEQDRLRLGERKRTLREQVSHLTVTTDTSGTVATSRLRDTLGTYLPAGTIVAEVDDVANLQCRIYVPEYEMREVRVGLPVTLVHAGSFLPLHSKVAGIFPAAVPAGDPLLPVPEFRGTRAPSYYVVTAVIVNSTGAAAAGETGTARIFIKRKSVMGFVRDMTYDFVRTKLW